MSTIKDLMAGSLIDEPVFKKKKRDSWSSNHCIALDWTKYHCHGRPISAQLYLLPAACTLCSAQPCSWESSSNLWRWDNYFFPLNRKLKFLVHCYFLMGKLTHRLRWHGSRPVCCSLKRVHHKCNSRLGTLQTFVLTVCLGIWRVRSIQCQSSMHEEASDLGRYQNHTRPLTLAHSLKYAQCSSMLDIL